jgi:serine phosphatase RsbU (regulator of sigma subunit)/anti-sigma regulatory factor (Ser/Thr protein kinase)
MTLRAILHNKPHILAPLVDHWQRVTGGQLLAVDKDGEWIAGDRPFTHLDNGALPEDWRDWLSEENSSQQPLIVEGQPVQIVPLSVQRVPIGYLVAVGEASPNLMRWSADTLEALLTAEQSLQGMTDELISAWDQLELVFRVTQTLASSSDLISVLRSVLAEVKQVLKASEGFLVIEQDDTMSHISVGGDDRLSPQRRQLFYRLQRAKRRVLRNDTESLHEFWPDAPDEIINLLGMRLPTSGSAQAVVGLINKEEHSFTAGDGKLLTAVAEQIAAIINNTLLHQRILAQERMQRELEIAAEIQVSLLPHGLPEVPGVEFAVASLPATEVGGDFYDFISLDEESLGIVVGDVAGKGVPAAMLTSLARTILRVEAGYGHSPQRVINQTNQALLQDLQRAEMFVTALVAYLNQTDLTLTYANAGHTPGLWWRADLGRFEQLAATTPPLGIQIPDLGGDRTLQLSPGDSILFYTDGVTETISPDSQIFGGDRLEEALAAHAGGTADDLVQSVLSAVRAFRRSAPWSDDITMIAMRVRPSATPQLPHREPTMRFALPADLQVLERISQQVTQVCRSLPDLPPAPASDDYVYLVELAVSEICTNIIQHAYLTAGGEIRGSITALDNGVQIDLYDDGVSFDPDAVPAPSAQAEALNEGGYGLHIVRQIMDSVQYQADTPKGNHWRLIKYIPSK